MPDELTCVIYNPAAGRGRAKKQIDKTRNRLAPHAELMPTEGPGHAVEVARNAVAKGYRRIIAAGGDGTVHEVANGILNANEPEAVLSIWPLGSMNDYAYTLGMLSWWQHRVPPPLDRMPVDVGTASTGLRTMWFVNSAGVGFNGMVTIESRKIRWLRGVPLYAWALLKSIAKHYSSPSFGILEGEARIDGPVLAYGIYLGQREGGFPIGKTALLDDGRFDTFHVTDIGRWELVRYLPGLITGNLPQSHPKLRRGQSARIEIRGSVPLCCHLDGELLCRPDEGQFELQFQLVPNRLIVECHRPGLYGK